MQNRRSLRHVAPVVLLIALVLVLAVALAPASAAGKRGLVPVQILAVNDFHGNLEATANLTFTPAGGSSTLTGGAAYLATHIANRRATNPNTIVVSAGDTIGASPLISGLFHDEPAIEAFNLMGVDVNAVGNHEFDEGLDELKRMQDGGCHPVDGCQDGDGFSGAEFRYLAANVVYEKNGKTVFPASKVMTVKGVKIGFIGLTLEGTPDIVSPSGVAGLDFLDEAETINREAARLHSRGVKTIVVLIHEGGFPAIAGEYNGCSGISGPIVDIVNNTTDRVDLFITGHTHNAYNCVIDGRPVTSAASFGRLLTDIDLEIGKADGEIKSMAINNVLVTRDVTADPTMQALITKYSAISAPLANRIIGSIGADIKRGANRQVEFPLGSLIADAQLDATNDPGFGDAVITFMNPGGVRADLLYNQISGGELPGQVTYGESFNVQPFGNSLVTMTMTGAQIDAVLEQQFKTDGTVNLLLQVSNGFTFSYSTSAPFGSKVDPTTIKLNSVTIDPNASYRVTVNSFLADGGDGFTVFKQGTDRLGGAVDTDALEAYLTANPGVMPPALGRVTILP